MSIVDFLKDTAEGKLSLDDQKEYLANKPFGSAKELAEAVKYLYSQMPETPNLPGAIDLCGTGGSGLPRINTSTISAFVVAGAGVKTAKHGNNSANGKFGSFDLLAALDVPIQLSAQELQLRFQEYNLAFLYAKTFHPVMRHFGPIRSEIKTPTFFNILGPLLSPVKAKKQLIGATKLEYARIIAEVSKELGKERVLVVAGQDGLDEVTLTGPTDVVELNNGKITEYQIKPEDFGIEPVKDFSKIASPGSDQNTEIAKDILTGKDGSERTDLVLINSAFVLYLAGKSTDLKVCYKLAKKSLVSGEAEKTLEKYRQPSVLSAIAKRDAKREFEVTKIQEFKPRKYYGGLIAEIKRRSPSEGEIAPDIDIVKQAQIYEQAGAKAISVLTEPEDFGGSFEDLTLVRKNSNLPILCKDFILRKEHIDAAKSAGTDMVLLIAAILGQNKLKELHEYANNLGLQVLVEVHNKSELDKALSFNSQIIGINARNLNDFSIDKDLFESLSAQIPKGIIKIAESGIENYRDCPKSADGILVGTVLMRHPFPTLKIKELTGRPIIKLCGIRSVDQARLCEELGVDMIGINFVPRSKRKIDIDTGKNILAACKNTIPVGVFENQDIEEIERIAKSTGVRAIQLSGNETGLESYSLPIIKTIKLGQAVPKNAFLIIIDNNLPGSGKAFDHSKLTEFEPSLIAGGVSLEVAKKLLKSKRPLGVDTASGIETEGQVDEEKIKAFAEIFSETSY